MPGEWIHRLEPLPLLVRRRSLIQCRQSSTHIPGRILIGDDLGPTRVEAHATVRVRKNESAKALPLPPSLDPVIVGAAIALGADQEAASIR